MRYPSAFANRLCDRRRADRTFHFDEIYWSDKTADFQKRGILVGKSETGVALLTGHRDTPQLGSRVHLAKSSGHDQQAEVNRVDRVSDIYDLIAAEYVPADRPNLRFVHPFEGEIQ